MKIKKYKSTGRIMRAVIVLFLLAVLFIGGGAVGKKPLKDLESDEVLGASVRLVPPDMEMELTEAEIAQLVNLLNNVVIYQRDESYSEYAGQCVEFTLTKQDGTQLSVAVYNPFIVMDGTGYRIKHDPCEELNRFANSLLTENR